MTPEQNKRFKRWQMRTILATMIGYALFYFVRKNFSLAMPGLEADLGISKVSLGIFLTLNGIIYGLSRFVNGVLADRMNARWYMAIGLALCALANFAFGFGEDISTWITGEETGDRFTNTMILFMGIMWVVNGLLQGTGFPPCARLLTHWIPPTELATKMSVWNTSHSIGAGLVVILCGYIMGHLGQNLSADPETVARIAANLGIGTDDPEGMDTVMNFAAHSGAWRWCFWIPSAIAFAGRHFGIDVEVYMVKVSYEQKPYRRLMMQTWGAQCFPSPSTRTASGRAALERDPDCSGSLGLAISEAVEMALQHPEDTRYCLGSVLNHVLLHQTVIGQEAVAQMEMADAEPDVVIGCIGGGSNFAGMAFPFLRKKLVEGKPMRVVAVEPASCPKLTRGTFQYDFGDVAGFTPLIPMYTLGHDFQPSDIHAGGLRYHGPRRLPPASSSPKPKGSSRRPNRRTPSPPPAAKRSAPKRRGPRKPSSSTSRATA